MRNDGRTPPSTSRSPAATASACARSPSGASRQASKMFSPARTSRPARACITPEARHALLAITTTPLESSTQTSPGKASNALSAMRLEPCSALCASGSSRAQPLSRSMTASISPASNASSSAVSVTNRRSQALNATSVLSGASSGSSGSGCVDHFAGASCRPSAASTLLVSLRLPMTLAPGDGDSLARLGVTRMPSSSARRGYSQTSTISSL